MQDLETGSLWSHVTGEALDGPMKGERLEVLPSVQTTWSRWLEQHPHTKMLAKERKVTGSRYLEYAKDPQRFGISRSHRQTERIPGKTLIDGIVMDGRAVAVTARALEEEEQIDVQIAGTPILVRRAGGGARAYRIASGRPAEEVPVRTAYWFAWISFYPNTDLIKAASR